VLAAIARAEHVAVGSAQINQPGIAGIGCERANIVSSRTHSSPGLSGEGPGDENREGQDRQACKCLSPHRIAPSSRTAPQAETAARLREAYDPDGEKSCCSGEGFSDSPANLSFGPELAMAIAQVAVDAATTVRMAGVMGVG
jgi:hypothetical protein